MNPRIFQYIFRGNRRDLSCAGGIRKDKLPFAVRLRKHRFQEFPEEELIGLIGRHEHGNQRQMFSRILGTEDRSRIIAALEALPECLLRADELCRRGNIVVPFPGPPLIEAFLCRIKRVRKAVSFIIAECFPNVL